MRFTLLVLNSHRKFTQHPYTSLFLSTKVLIPQNCLCECLTSLFTHSFLMVWPAAYQFRHRRLYPGLKGEYSDSPSSAKTPVTSSAFHIARQDGGKPGDSIHFLSLYNYKENCDQGEVCGASCEGQILLVIWL